VFIGYAIVSFTGPTSGCGFGTMFSIQEDISSTKMEGTTNQQLFTTFSPFQLLESALLS
jgi:hypothetical protein